MCDWGADGLSWGREDPFERLNGKVVGDGRLRHVARQHAKHQRMIGQVKCRNDVMIDVVGAGEQLE